MTISCPRVAVDRPESSFEFAEGRRVAGCCVTLTGLFPTVDEWVITQLVGREGSMPTLPLGLSPPVNPIFPETYRQPQREQKGASRKIFGVSGITTVATDPRQ